MPASCPSSKCQSGSSISGKSCGLRRSSAVMPGHEPSAELDDLAALVHFHHVEQRERLGHEGARIDRRHARRSYHSRSSERSLRSRLASADAVLAFFRRPSLTFAARRSTRRTSRIENNFLICDVDRRACEPRPREKEETSPSSALSGDQSGRCPVKPLQGDEWGGEKRLPHAVRSAETGISVRREKDCALPRGEIGGRGNRR